MGPISWPDGAISALFPGGIWELEAIMRTSIAVAVLLMVCTGAKAQTKTECGKSNGYAYYFSGGAVPASGWKKDWIDGGQIILNFINREADLLVTNATLTASVRQAGGKIYLRKAVNGLIALTVFYDDTAITEDYVFQLDGQGNGTVAWTAIRTATATNKISLMIAQCRGPR
jgi:hypothetical protein